MSLASPVGEAGSPSRKGGEDVTQDFNIKVEDAGDLYPVGRYSGGEMDDIALAVRIAISESYMPKA